MSIIVKVMGAGTKTATYMDGSEVKHITLLPGRNKLTDQEWDCIKDTPMIEKKLRYDEITFSEMVEPKAVAPKEKIDMEKAEAFVGLEDGKDMLFEYAKGFGYHLRKNMNIDNMLKDLKAKIEG